MTDTLATNPHRLIEAYRSYAHAISAEVLKKLPSSVDRDDVIGAAELGLVEAARSFDPSRGVLFKTFAYYRIRGAIYDALRKMGWLRGEPRQRFEERANEYLKDYTAAAASGSSTASAESEELRQLTSGVVTSFMLSLDASDMEVADPATVSAEEQLIQSEARTRLKEALAQLPEDNRLLIEQYYYGDATLEEIGGRLGFSKSWVCRLHAKSLDMLRALMAPSKEQAAVR
jgi:RNA polymerase sigma factor for flagellar operon FliA